jgi:Bardet-Biedl syndrome 7 protein
MKNEFRQNEAIFKSENVSTISILKDALSKKATDKKVSLNIELGKCRLKNIS